MTNSALKYSGIWTHSFRIGFFRPPSRLPSQKLSLDIPVIAKKLARVIRY